MKKLFVALLAVAMLCSCLTVLAEAGGSNSAVFYQELGLTMDIQTVLDECVNFVSIESDGVYCHDPYVAEARFVYYAIPTAEVSEMYASATTEQEQDNVMEYLNTMCTPVGFLYVTNAPDADSMYKAIGIEMEQSETIEEIAVHDSWRYFYVTVSADDFLTIYDDAEAIGMELTEEEAMAAKEAAAAEIAKVNSEAVEIIRASAYVTPEDPDGVFIGQTIQFETTDLDGNPVSSEDLFKDNKITMVNLWGTWCSACVGEMPELAEVHKRLQEKGCGIVGVEVEDEEPAVYKPKSEKIIAETGITYPNVLKPADNPIFRYIAGFPMSYFVDSEGKILTYPICGNLVSQYETTIDKLLAGETVDLGPENGATPGSGDEYCVYVYDTEGKPVEGVIIQFCDDRTCTLKPTDANGVATFEVDAQKVYDIHVLKVPEGFRQDEKAYQTLENYSDVSIFLDRAE